MSNTWDVGDVVTIGVVVRDSAGAAADATDVTVTVTAPDGSLSTPDVVRTAVGTYEAGFLVQMPGRWGYRFVATGANTSSHADVFNVLDPANLPVVSLGEAKDMLKISATSSDEILRRFIDAATQAGESHTRRVFGRRTVTETHYQGGMFLILKQVPVLSVSSVLVNGEAVSGWGVVNAKSGLVTRDGTLRSSFWQDSPTTVTYVAGYQQQPAYDRQGVLEMIRHLWETQRGAVLAQPNGLGDWNPSQSFSIPRRVQELWDQDLMGSSL